MSIRARAIETVRSAGLLPQAVIGRPVRDILRAVAVDVERGTDEFDDFEGAAFSLDEGISFAVKHYKGHPPGTSTVYLPPEFRNIDHITKLLRVILQDLRLEPDDLMWQRADGPEL